MMSHVFCGCTQEAFRHGSLNHWPRGMTLGIQVEQAPPGFSIDAMEDVVNQAMRRWNEITYIPWKIARGRDRVNIRIITHNFDGAGGVLADAQVVQPGANERTRLTMRFDSGERFTTSINPVRGTVDIVAVMMHEGGHTFGLGHAPNGSDNLMASAIRKRGQREFGDWDEGEITRRNGLPRREGGGGIPAPINPTIASLCELILGREQLRRFGGGGSILDTCDQFREIAEWFEVIQERCGQAQETLECAFGGLSREQKVEAADTVFRILERKRGQQ